MPWAEERDNYAEPAGPSSGEHWAYEQVQKGDTTCAANQDLHAEAANLLESKSKKTPLYNPPVADPLDPVTFVNKINVPTFMACQWEDEQTGGHCADLAEHFTGTKAQVVHLQQTAPISTRSIRTRSTVSTTSCRCTSRAWLRPYKHAAAVHAAARSIYQSALGVPSGNVVLLPLDPIQELRGYYQGAGGSSEALPEVRVLFDNGAGTSPIRQHDVEAIPTPASNSRSPAFPIPGTSGRWGYLGPEGTLNEQPGGSRRCRHPRMSNASATPLTDYSSNTGPWGPSGDAADWEWNWTQPVAGDAVTYLTAPLSARHDGNRRRRREPVGEVVDSGRASDLQATVSEVRPTATKPSSRMAGSAPASASFATTSKNMFNEVPTPVQPIPTFLASDQQAMPAGEFVPVTIPLYFEGHAYRAGSRIRVTIAAPNGTQPIWSFGETQPEGGYRQRVDRLLAEHAVEPHPADRAGGQRADGVAGVPRVLPNEPCRSYQAFVNNGS